MEFDGSSKELLCKIKASFDRCGNDDKPYSFYTNTFDAAESLKRIIMIFQIKFKFDPVNLNNNTNRGFILFKIHIDNIKLQYPITEGIKINMLDEEIKQNTLSSRVAYV